MIGILEEGMPPSPQMEWLISDQGIPGPYGHQILQGYKKWSYLSKFLLISTPSEICQIFSRFFAHTRPRACA